jgi:hypothetical protein
MNLPVASSLNSQPSEFETVAIFPVLFHFLMTVPSHANRVIVPAEPSEFQLAFWVSVQETIVEVMKRAPATAVTVMRIITMLENLTSSFFMFSPFVLEVIL